MHNGRGQLLVRGSLWLLFGLPLIVLAPLRVIFFNLLVFIILRHSILIIFFFFRHFALNLLYSIFFCSFSADNKLIGYCQRFLARSYFWNSILVIWLLDLPIRAMPRGCFGGTELVERCTNLVHNRRSSHRVWTILFTTIISDHLIFPTIGSCELFVQLFCML